MEKVLVWQDLRMHIDWKVYTENADKSTVKLNKCIVFYYVEIKGKKTQNLECLLAESLIRIPLMTLGKIEI